jgi:hypothetical protein
MSRSTGPRSLECRTEPLYRNSGNQPAPLPAVRKPVPMWHCWAVTAFEMLAI